MARILVTGASGLVGTALLPMFGPDDEVHALMRAPAALDGATAVHAADLGTPFDTARLPDAVDAVVYLAQSDNYRAFPEQAADIFAVNVASLFRMLDYARRAGARAFVIASSGSVYPTSSAPVTEDAHLAANGACGFYPTTKLLGEMLGDTFAPYMNVAMLRFFFVYGRKQKRSMLLPRLVDTIRDGRPVVLGGRDGIRINPVHASDAAAACRAALALSGVNRINVAGPDVLSMRAICDLIGARIGRVPVFDVREGSPEADLVADTSMMARLLGAPQRRFVDALDELL